MIIAAIPYKPITKAMRKGDFDPHRSETPRPISIKLEIGIFSTV